MATINALPPGNIKVTVFSATGSFVPDPRALQTRVQLQAAGGPSTSFTNGSSIAMGCSGGSGGGYIEVLFTAPIVLANVTVTLGVPASPGANSPNSTFGTYVTAAGGVRGVVVSTAGTEAMIVAPQTPISNSVAFGALAGTTLVDVRGGQGTGAYIPRRGDYGFLKGGDGGDSVWGYGGRSDAAIFSGSGGYTSAQRNGIGYGFGSPGWAYGSTSAASGTVGGVGRCIVTEYF